MRTLTILLILLFGLFEIGIAQQFEYKPAENIGGRKQFNDFVMEEMVYPEIALKNGIQGKVKITMMVTAQGEVQKTKITNSVSSEIDDEALRILRYFLWKPPVQRGKPVDGETTVEIDFRIKKYRRAVAKRGYERTTYPHEPVDASMKVYQMSQTDRPPRPVYDDPKLRFNDFIQNNLVYPPLAVRQGISGTVKLFFVVEPSGRSSNIEIMESVGGGCNEEATRLLKLMNWMPGILNGEAVRTEMTMSITFNLSNYENLRYVPGSHQGQF
jgi:TonB family protein